MQRKIGEIGLDYHYGTQNKKVQFEVLNKQIDIANRYNLPVIFHIRDAFPDFFTWLEQNRGRFGKGVVHCFDGDEVIAKKLVEWGLFVSFTGLATFKPREDIRRAIEAVPLDRIMVETDAPYLAPTPFRGKLNSPVYLKYIAQEIAKLRNTDIEEIKEKTTNNAKRIFNF